MGITLVEMVLSATILVHCPQREIRNVPHHLSATSNASCYADCQCSPQVFEPVCDRSTSVTFYSACYAGCQSSDMTECSCLLQHQSVSFAGQNASSQPQKPHEVVDGFCEQDCLQKYLAAVGQSALECFQSPSCLWGLPLCCLGLGFFCLTMLVKVPIGLSGSLALLDSPELASLALAVANITLRVLGMCTGPLLFGAIMDTNCKLWFVSLKVIVRTRNLFRSTIAAIFFLMTTCWKTRMYLLMTITYPGIPNLCPR